MEELKQTKLWSDYENAKAYQREIGLTTQVPENVKFYEGDHWAPPTPLTRNLPRPVLNITEMIVDNKVSNVLGSPVKLNYVADNSDEATEIFTNFAQYIQKEYGQETLDALVVQDGAVKGTGIYHLYWDETVAGLKGNYEGGLRAEIIDVLNIFFANPLEKDEQKQEWIIISKREQVKSVREIADKGVNKELIVSDNPDNDYLTKEQQGSELCTLLTRYFRKNGEVYFEKATKEVIVNKPRLLNPILVEEMISIDEDGNENIDGEIIASPDSDLEIKEDDVDRYKAQLYPIVVFRWKDRDKSIYGRGEVEKLIPNQKAINFHIAMTLLNAQELGAPKIVVKQGALQGQTITNAPAQVITDYSQGNGMGIQAFQVQPFSQGLLQIAPGLIDLTRMATNSTEVVTGEMLSKDLSGTAIAQLQAQAAKPIAKLQKNFWRAKEKIGKILEQFFKLYYEDGKDFSYELSEDKYQQLEMKAKVIKEKTGENTPVSKVVSHNFKSSDFRNFKFSIIVEAGAGTQYSEIATMQMLDTLFQMDKITFEQYVELYPKTAMPFKAELRAIIKRNEQSENTLLKQQVLQLSNQLKQAAIKVKEQDYLLKNNQVYTDNLIKEFEKRFNTLKLSQGVKETQEKAV